MPLKQSVLQILELNRSNFISGEQIASELNVSRAAVWKAIKALENEGYIIHCVTNKGYQLSKDNDLISKEGITPFLKENYKNNNIIVYKTIGSTNDEAKLKALESCPHGSVIIAETQTKGKGRMGRSFYSPAGSGIYMSFILRPKTDASNAVLLTTAAAVAVCRAIKSACGLKTKIKWLNDIYYKDKKICGILSEAVTNCETGMVESVVVGIGINFKTEFSGELMQTAGSLYAGVKPPITRNRLIAEVINQMLDISEDFVYREFLNEYKEDSFVIGQDIVFFRNNIWHNAKAVDIADNGGLVVQYESRQIETLFSGEITIRKKD
ncbi:MAG: biotin--[acetyl-CoA-carboxylase] ligase [Eubacteriaceae bacterium]|nr:biotin--[acetyl-CoA-carboxylase] ligase [Eubacteriaceae bacterium]